MSALARLQMLRLASPALPIGGFAWSAGLEAAIADGSVTGAAGVAGGAHGGSPAAWLDDVLRGHARWDAPVLWRLLLADEAGRARWNADYLASRETRELRAETLQMGGSLVRLLRELGHEAAATAPPEPTFPCAWALAAQAWAVPAEAALEAWLMAFCESQVAVLQKALPLGQVAAQRVLAGAFPAIARAAESARTIADEDLSSSLPGLAILSSQHETQYSRLFRS